jgi:hypothetical protein
VATVAEDEESGTTTITEGCTRAPKGFFLAGLDDSATSGALQHKTHQYISKLEFEEEKCLSTSASVSSSVEPNVVSSREICLHQRVRHQQLQPVTFGEML